MENRTPFEQKIRQTFPHDEMDPTFSNRLQADLRQREASLSARRAKTSWRWAYALTPLLLALVLLLAAGPNRVLAQIRAWIGYVPGGGLVTAADGIRVLAMPVSQTKDGVTVTVKDGVFTKDRSSLEVSFENLPTSAHFSHNFGEPVCEEESYLLLPDGTQLTGYNSFDAIPADVNEAVFVLPCIPMRTLGKAPENWQLSLKFIPAPDDFVVYPVSVPEPQVNLQANLEDKPGAEQPVEAPAETHDGLPVKDIIEILAVIEKPDAWVLGFGYKGPHLEDYYNNADLSLVDAAGKPVPYSYYYQDIGNLVNELYVELNRNNTEFTYTGLSEISIPKGDYAFPLTLTEVVNHVGRIDIPRDQVLFEFDAGTDPKPGDVWEINQTLDLGGYEVRVLKASVTDTIALGYCFEMDGGEQVESVDVYLPDHWSNFGSGSGSPFNPPFIFSDCVMIDPLPKGMIKVALQQEPALLLGRYLARGTWSPEE